MDIHTLEAGKPSVRKMNYVRHPKNKWVGGKSPKDSHRAVFKV